jgi:hypothetical protein
MTAVVTSCISGGAPSKPPRPWKTGAAEAAHFNDGRIALLGRS